MLRISSTCISRTLNTIRPEYGTIFDLDDTGVLRELLRAIENPSNGAMAFARQVKNLDWKRSFIKHYSSFLELQFDLVRARKETEEKKEEEFVEGQLSEIRFFRRKRNRALREECIRMFGGYKCYVCGFDFETVYGDRGREFIEVHHLKPMSGYDDEHPITPDELRPICSNCHAMIHRDPSGGVTDINLFKAEYLKRNC